MSGQELTYTVAFSAGLLSFLSPCVLPLVPVYLGYLTGAGAGNQQIAVAQGRFFTMVHAVAFIVGFSLIFMAWGAIGGAIGDLVSSEWFLRIGAILVIIMGLHLLGAVRIPLLYTQKRMEVQQGPNPNVFSSLAIGAAFGAGWTPCVGPILAGILLLSTSQGGVLAGTGLLAVYSLGLAVPFLLVAAGLGQATGTIRRLGPYLRYVEMASGLLLVLIGLLLFSGYFTYLNAYFIQLTPEWLLERL